MLSFLSRLVSCTSESSLPKDDEVSTSATPAEIVAQGLAAASPPAAAEAVIVPPTPSSEAATQPAPSPDTKGLFIGHAEPSYVPSKPFVSYGDYSNSKTVADAMASKPAACAKAPVQDEAVGAAIAAAVVAAAVSDEAKPANKSEYLAYWAPDSFTNSALASKAEFEESLRLGEGARCMLERAARGIVDPSAPPPRKSAAAPTMAERVFLD